MAQVYPDFKCDNKQEIEKSVVFESFKNEFDFLIAKYETCYWFEKNHYEIIAYRNGSVRKFRLIQDKESNAIKIKKVRIRKRDTRDYIKLPKELKEKGFFELKNGPLNVKGRDNEDGTRSVISISDGHTYVIEIFKGSKYKKLYSYCPERYLKEFPEMKSRKLFLDCLEIFKSYWHDE